MKHTKRLLAMLLALVLMLTPIIPVQAAADTQIKENTLYLFDLQTYIHSLESTECQYDYLKLATALQGLVNRDEPLLFFDFEEHQNYAQKYNMDMDRWWLEQLQSEPDSLGLLKNGKDLADYEVVTIKGFWQMLKMFSDYYNGIVLWDEDVPSTANVASTVAGVENLLPVRFSVSQDEDDLYLQLLKNGFTRADIKRDLTNLFTGEGYIPTLGSSVPGAKMEYTTTPSTKSIKTDPYVWAKMYYLDTGLTNPLLMTYSLDANRSTWPSYIVNPHPAHGDFVDGVLPTMMEPNEVRMFQITFENTGTQVWEANSFYRLGIEPEEIFRIYPDAACKQQLTSKQSRLALTKDVAPGEEYTFTGYIKAPRKSDTYNVTFVMVLDGETNISSKFTQEIIVKRGAVEALPYEPFVPTETPDYETEAIDAQILHANVPSSAAPEASLRIQAAIKNVGSENWAANAYKLAVTLDGKTSYAALDALDAGESASVTLDITTPKTADTYNLELQVVDANGNAIGDLFETSVAVGAAGELGCTVASLTYPTTIRLGEKGTATLELVNTGEKAWSLNGTNGSEKVKLVSDNAIAYISLPGASNDKNLLRELNFEGGITVEPGEHYLFHFDLHTCLGTTPLAEAGERILMTLGLVDKDGTSFGADIPLSYTVVAQDMEDGKVVADPSDVPVNGTGLKAELIEICLPDTLYKGEYTPFYYTVKNTGDITWKPYKQNFVLDQPLLGISPESAKPDESGVDALVELYHADRSSQGSRKSRMRIPTGVEVAPGECFTFFGYMFAPMNAKECEKEYTLSVLAEGIGGSAVASHKWNLTIEPGTLSAAQEYLDTADEAFVIELDEEFDAQIEQLLPDADAEVTTPACTADNMTQIVRRDASTYIAEYISSNLPSAMAPGEVVTFQLNFKNAGTTTFYTNDSANKNIRMSVPGYDKNNAGNYFGLSLASANNFGGDCDLPGNHEIKPGETWTINAKLKAPTTTGKQTLTLGFWWTNTNWYKYAFTKEITIVDPNASSTTITTDLPATATPYEELSVKATAVNGSANAWAVPSGVTAPVAAPSVDGVYLKYSYENCFDPTMTATSTVKNPFIGYAPLSAATAANAEGTFSFKFHTPVVEGTYSLTTQVVSIASGVETAIGAENKQTYTNAGGTAVNAGKKVSTTAAADGYHMSLTEAKVPTVMDPGEKAFVSFTYLNDGKDMAIANKGKDIAVPADRVRIRMKDGSDDGFKLYDYGFGLNWNSPSTPKAGTIEDRTNFMGFANGDGYYTSLNLRDGTNTRDGQGQHPANQSRTYTGLIEAPTKPGTYTVQFAATAAGTTDISDVMEFTITVEDPRAPLGEATLKPITQNNKESALVARLISDNIPDEMIAGESTQIEVAVKNVGTAAWYGNDIPERNNRLRIVEHDGKSSINANMATQFNFARHSNGAPLTWSIGANFEMSGSGSVAVGGEYTYKPFLHAPTTPGTYTLTIGVNNSNGGAWYRDSFTKTIKVIKPIVPEEYDDKAANAAIIHVGLPEEIKAGEPLNCTVRVKNTGEPAWSAADGYALRCKIGRNTYYLDAAATSMGYVCTFTLDSIPTPSDAGSMELELQMVKRSGGKDVLVGKEQTVELTLLHSYDAVISVSEFAEEMRAGSKDTIVIKAQNIGTETWKAGQVALLEQNGMAYLSALGAGDDDSLTSMLFVETDVAPGEHYVFAFDRHTWKMDGKNRAYLSDGTEFTLNMQMQYAGKAFGSMESLSCLITEKESVSEEVILAEDSRTPVTDADVLADFLSYKLPKIIRVNQTVPVEFVVKNTGTKEWKSYDDYGKQPTDTQEFARLAFDSMGFFKLLKVDDAHPNGFVDHTQMARIDFDTKETLPSGECKTFRGLLTAPSSPGLYTITLGMICEGRTNAAGNFDADLNYWIENTIKIEIEVEGGDVLALDTIEVDEDYNFQYPLFQSPLPNADYYIAKKAFFWDLSPEDYHAPIDDRTQPIGTDVKVLRSLLRSQMDRAQAFEEGRDPWNKTAGVGEQYGIFTVGGFVPWFVKYCNSTDKESTWQPATSEWHMVEMISEYGGQTDADAFGTTALNNGSVYTHIKLQVEQIANSNPNFTQNREGFDPLVGDPSVVYDPDTKYIFWGMGDWDGAAWTHNIFSLMWEIDQHRGEFPVGWLIGPGLSDRIPHVYNWIYSNVTPNDYLIVGDNGTDYANISWMYYPQTEISGVTKAEGEELMADFVQYNVDYNEMFKLGIQGFYIEGFFPKDMDEPIFEANSQMTPYGVINVRRSYPTYTGKKTGIATPFPMMTNLSGTIDTPEKVAAAMNVFERLMKFGGQFLAPKTCKSNLDEVVGFMKLFDERNPGVKYKIVDPYTFMRLYKEAGENATKGYQASYTAAKAGGITIDGVVSANEWDGAQTMTISPKSPEISQHGFNWNANAFSGDEDMTVKYRVKWDNKNIYVLEERIDNMHALNENTAAINWTTDAGALYIDTDGTDGSTNYTPGDFAVHWSVDAAGKPTLWRRTGTNDRKKIETNLMAGVDYSAAYTLGENGNRIFEIAIPWSTLGGYKPAAGATIGMTTLAIDSDPGNTSSPRQIMWHGYGDAQSAWSKMTFGS